MVSIRLETTNYLVCAYYVCCCSSFAFFRVHCTRFTTLEKYDTRHAQLNDVLFRGLKLVVTLALLGHLFGCFWSFVSLSEEASPDVVADTEPRTWWEKVGLEREDLMGRYIASIYWAFTTMTTVG